MTEEQQESFKQAAMPLIQWLCENVHPHHTAVVTPTNAELLEGQCTTGQVLTANGLGKPPAVCGSA